MNTKNITSQTSQVGGIKINERANVSDTGISDILRMLEGKGTYATVPQKQEKGMKLSECDDIFLVECSSYEEMIQLKDFWVKNFKKKTAFASELIEGREIPEYSGYFEQGGKYYILGALYYSPNRRNLASSDGTHNGILWYPSSGTKEVAKQTVITSERTGDVLKKPSVSD